ncbi:MAG: class I SAM-dependent methyltransferase [bacterium]|nr:class I SAM-dependent methyltransferase [bacterium]
MKENNLHFIEKMYSRLDKMLLDSQGDCYYLNLGYWKDTNNANLACEALIDLVLSKAELKDGFKILDAGFGYGHQDVYIAKKNPNLHIFGVNIMPRQVEIAKQKVQKEFLSNRVFLFEGSATKLPFENDTFDAVIAIESAFHFDTRESFFEESWRVLKKDGVLCLTDCLPLSNFTKNEQFFLASQKMGIPIENQYPIDEYVSKLSINGFEKISYQNLSEFVLPHSAAEMKQKNGWRSKKEVYLPQNIDLNQYLKGFTEATTIGSYYLIKAHKK